MRFQEFTVRFPPSSLFPGLTFSQYFCPVRFPPFPSGSLVRFPLFPFSSMGPELTYPFPFSSMRSGLTSPFPSLNTSVSLWRSGLTFSQYFSLVRFPPFPFSSIGSGLTYPFPSLNTSVSLRFPLALRAHFFSILLSRPFPSVSLFLNGNRAHFSVSLSQYLSLIHI